MMAGSCHGMYKHSPVVCSRKLENKIIKYANEKTDDIIHSNQCYVKYINRAILANL